MTLWEKVRQLDLIGAILLLFGIVFLLLALQWGGNVVPWHTPGIVYSLVAFGLISVVFVYWQYSFGDRY